MGIGFVEASYLAAGLSSMDKMWASFYSMGLMAAASVLVLFARHKMKGIIRFLMTLIAFVMLLPALLLMLASMS